MPAEVVDEDGELKKVAPYPESSEASDTTHAWVYANYNRLIERYTECNLTFGSDKLVAFSGLARRLSQQLKVEPTSYLAGLWKETFLHDLLWRVEVRSQDRCRMAARQRIPGRAPSWSYKMSSLLSTLIMHGKRFLLLRFPVAS